MKNIVQDIKFNTDGIPYRELNLEDGTFKLFNTNLPYRLEDESYMEYKIRRNFNNQTKKLKLKGRVIWPSAQLKTFIKADIEKLLKEQNIIKEKQNGEENITTN